MGWYLGATSPYIDPEGDFWGSDGYCLQATEEVLEYILCGELLADRYQIFGKSFQQVVCAFIYGYSLKKFQLFNHGLSVAMLLYEGMMLLMYGNGERH